MPFAYYARLNAHQKKIYRASDAVNWIELGEPEQFLTNVTHLQQALDAGDRHWVRLHTQALCNRLTRRLEIPDLAVEILDVRPSNEYEELHGFYRPQESAAPASITLWMFTAQRHKVVAFKTFLRTALHELCHHIDYEFLGLEESFHTHGFYQRENSLFRQLVSQ